HDVPNQGYAELDVLRLFGEGLRLLYLAAWSFERNALLARHQMEVQMENLLIARALVVLLDRQTIGRQAARNQPHRVDEVSKLVRVGVENIARRRFGDADGVFRGTRPRGGQRRPLVS